MSHAASRRRGLPGDESYYGFLDVFLDVIRSRLFGAAADLADHHDGVRIGIFVEQPDRVDKRGADDRVAADADAGGLSDPQSRELADRFVGQVPDRETTPTWPGLWIYAGMMPILHFPGEMTPGQLGPMSRVFGCSLR